MAQAPVLPCAHWAPPPPAEKQRGGHPCSMVPRPASNLWLSVTGLLLGGREPERDGEDEGPVPARDSGEAEELDQPHPLPGQHLGLQCSWRRAPERPQAGAHPSGR